MTPKLETFLLLFVIAAVAITSAIQTIKKQKRERTTTPVIYNIAFFVVFAAVVGLVIVAIIHH